jgi:hypothetical protein
VRKTPLTSLIAAKKARPGSLPTRRENRIPDVPVASLR